MAPRCPICKREIQTRPNPFRPFCSERCRMIDLDNWLSGRYRISSPLTDQGQKRQDKENEAPTEENLD